MAENNVRIIRNGAGCQAVPDPFKAKRGSEVMFEFEDHPDAEITFDGESPFDGEAGSKTKLKPEKNKVKKDARPDRYPYTVRWGGGKGAGSGEIIP
jgi:hypothetical protein